MLRVCQAATWRSEDSTEGWLPTRGVYPGHGAGCSGNKGGWCTRREKGREQEDDEILEYLPASLPLLCVPQPRETLLCDLPCSPRLRPQAPSHNKNF